MDWKLWEERLVLPLSEEFKIWIELATQENANTPGEAFSAFGIELPWLNPDFSSKTVDYLRPVEAPPEVFPFAWNLEHTFCLGFLSDTGLDSMKKCPIVAVSSTQDPPCWVLASDFVSFLGLFRWGDLAQLQEISKKKTPLVSEGGGEGGGGGESTAPDLSLSTPFQASKPQKKCFQIWEKTFSLNEIPDPLLEIQKAQTQRKAKTVLNSGDGLGVIQIPGTRVENQPISVSEATKRLSRKKMREEMLFQMSLELDTMIASGALTSAIGSVRNLLKVAGNYKCGNMLKQVTSSVYNKCSLGVLSEAILCTPYPD
jgi:hypothetical protein